MNISNALEQLDGTNVAALAYSPGYTAYVSEDEEPGTYFLTYCKSEMPPHETRRFTAFEDLMSYLTGQDQSNGWHIENISA